ncbi:uracil-DNA glycosylase [Thiomicrolovo sp. ZZH C-3]
MKSYQNAALLQNLYRLKALGFDYCDPVIVNPRGAPGELPNDLGALQHIVSSCHLCDLAKIRRQSMVGTGSGGADLMIIDAYVSMAQDESGEYFAGRSGASLESMITNVLGLDPAAVYLTHTVKCKGGGTQKPTASECSSCKPYWRKEIELIRPKVIVTLGPDAYRIVTDDSTPFEQVRGHKIDYDKGTLLVPLYHPQYLLRNPSLKKVTFFDLQNIKAAL